MEEKNISIDQGQLVMAFVEAIKDDPRINTAHISLYVSLISHWHEKNFENPVAVFSHEIMPLCKIAGTATYHRSIRDLHEFGYIIYEPSHNHFKRSLIYFTRYNCMK